MHAVAEPPRTGRYKGPLRGESRLGLATTKQTPRAARSVVTKR
jgi:hypothetical protein